MREALAHCPVELPAAHPRHDQVADDQVNQPALMVDHFQRLGTVRRQQHPVVEILNRLSHGFPRGGIILGDEDDPTASQHLSRQLSGSLISRNVPCQVWYQTWPV